MNKKAIATRSSSKKGRQTPRSKVKAASDELKEVSAFPSKAFFVEMLTRDIELEAAILDLLDNSLDGVLRKLKENTKHDAQGNGKKHSDADNEKKYKGFWAHIEFNKNFFRISDNCGGISRDILKSAFRLGSPNLEQDKDLPTVGLYGIGMKRAIFKMGKSCTVTTRHGKEAYRIEISPEWMENDELWKLDVEKLDATGLTEGTIIEVRHLRDAVSRVFDTETNVAFVNDFQNEVSETFSYIIHKGLTVTVDKTSIKAKSLHLRLMEDPSTKSKIAPFLYEGKVNDVDVKLVVGLYRSIPTEQEAEEINKGEEKNKKENAGWTIICNDRVVLYNDTTHVTGWGEATVPRYHSQFIAIAGIVRFDSVHPEKLPLTTTKRGINLNSETYATVKNLMREGLKHFTNFTYKWKSDSQERREIYKQTKSVEAFDVFNHIDEGQWTKAKKEGGRKFVPKLPAPSQDSTDKVIRFSRPQAEIETVSTYLFEEPDAAPPKVGEECFDRFLAKAEAEFDE